MNVLKNFIGLALVGSIILSYGCKGGNYLTEDLSSIPDFQKSLPSLAPNDTTYSLAIDANDVDLYIDYSTCVSEAINSPYYQAVHPTIVDCNPTFYSIKGPKITEETKDRQTVYQLLRTIKEVNNADIKQAVNRIVNGNRQAVLITDGEYFMPGATGDNLNNPYLSDLFRVWLSKGRDIYIYSEPYVESGKFNKFRYYMLFTDHRVTNNIEDKFQRGAPKSQDVKMFHLSTTPPQVAFSEKYPDINGALSMNPEASKRFDGYEIEEFQTDWESIYKYIKEGAVDDMGNPLPKGDYVLRGLFLNSSANDAFKLTELEATVYNVYPSYQAFTDSIALNAPRPVCTTGEKLNKVFTVDNDIFKNTGEVVLRLDPDFDGSSLSSEMPNLLKVDISVKASAENFSENADINKNFRWTSISVLNGGKENTSLYESIRQVLIDPQIHPESTPNKVAYTFYLSTMPR